MKWRIIEVVVAVLIFGLGATFGKLLNWGYFELSREISIIEAVTLFATLGLGLYITRVLEKKVQDVRLEKALYIAKVTEIETILRSIEVLFEEPVISYKKGHSTHTVLSHQGKCRLYEYQRSVWAGKVG
jgi:hypothetical protein